MVAWAMQPGAARADLHRHGDMALRSGVLSQPSARSAEAIVARYLASDPPELDSVDPKAFRVERQWPIGSGALITLRQQHHGVPVVGASLAVRVDDRGQVRWSASRIRHIPESLETVPALSDVDALERAGGPAARTLDPTRRTRLVVLARGTEPPRLAWMVRLPEDWSRLESLRVFVDAQTGEQLAQDNLMHTAAPRARVFPVNPVVTPELVTVDLDTLPEGSETLENGDLRLRSCVDNQVCYPTWEEFHHGCEYRAVARANASGDFTDYTYLGDRVTWDGFAEVQAFYHASRAYQVARALGAVDELCPNPLDVIVDYRRPAEVAAADCDGERYLGGDELAPFDNAAFSPGGETMLPKLGRPTLLFGQGVLTDYAYDGDVVYHELGHAVTFANVPLFGTRHVDTWGYDGSAAALHEAFADLMALFVTDDPDIGGYVQVDSRHPGPIRSLDNTLRCPRDLTGEPHHDSQIFSGAVYDARLAIGDTPERRDRLYAAILTAEKGFGSLETFASAAALIRAEVEVVFGPEEAAQVEAAFDARNDEDCTTRVLWGQRAKEVVYYPGFQPAFGAGRMPGWFQMRTELSHPADRIVLDVAHIAFVNKANTTIHAVLRPGSLMEWIRVGVRYEGNYDQIALLSQVDSSHYQAVFEGPWPPGTYYLQLVGRGPPFYAYGTWVATVDDQPEAPGCQIGGPRSPVGGGGPILLLGLVGLLWLRSRPRAA